MDEQAVLASHLVAKLAQGFQERLGLNIAHRPADFEDHDLRACFLCGKPDAAFDLVGDVRDDLNCPAQIIAAAFLCDGLGIHLSRREVADPRQAVINKPLVVTQVEVGFRAVIQHVHFAMLIG